MYDIEEKYEILTRKYEKLQREYENLKERFDKQYDELSHVNFRVKDELEPRIRAEKRAYDRWVTDPER